MYTTYGNLEMYTILTSTRQKPPHLRVKFAVGVLHPLNPQTVHQKRAKASVGAEARFLQLHIKSISQSWLGKKPTMLETELMTETRKMVLQQALCYMEKVHQGTVRGAEDDKWWFRLDRDTIESTVDPSRRDAYRHS